VDKVGPETIVGIFWCLPVGVRLAMRYATKPFPTNLSLWVALFVLEHYIVVRTESEVTAFTLERR